MAAMGRLRNPKHTKYTIPRGYTDLGWQVGRHEKRDVCRELGHKEEHYDNSEWMHTGTEHIYFCRKCKYIYHIDSSD